MRLYFKIALLSLFFVSGVASARICFDGKKDAQTKERISYLKAAFTCANLGSYQECEDLLMKNEESMGRIMGAALFSPEASSKRDKTALIRLSAFTSALAQVERRDTAYEIYKAIDGIEKKVSDQMSMYQGEGVKKLNFDAGYLEAERTLITERPNELQKTWRQKLVSAFNNYDSEMESNNRTIDSKLQIGGPDDKDIGNRGFTIRTNEGRIAQILRDIHDKEGPEEYKKASTYAEYRKRAAYPKLLAKRLQTLKGFLEKSPNNTGVIANVLNHLPYDDLDGYDTGFRHRMAYAIGEVNYDEKAYGGFSSSKFSWFLNNYGKKVLAAGAVLAPTNQVFAAVKDEILDPTKASCGEGLSPYMSVLNDCKAELDMATPLEHFITQKSEEEQRKVLTDSRTFMCDYVNAVYEKQFNWKVTCTENGLTATRGLVKYQPEFKEAAKRELELTWDDSGAVKSLFMNGAEAVASKLYRLEINGGEPTSLRLISEASLKYFKKAYPKTPFKLEDQHLTIAEEKNLKKLPLEPISKSVMQDYRSLRLSLAEMKGCCQDATKLGSRCEKYGIKTAAQSNLSPAAKGAGKGSMRQ